MDEIHSLAHKLARLEQENMRLRYGGVPLAYVSFVKVALPLMLTVALGLFLIVPIGQYYKVQTDIAVAELGEFKIADVSPPKSSSSVEDLEVVVTVESLPQVSTVSGNRESNGIIRAWLLPIVVGLFGLSAALYSVSTAIRFFLNAFATTTGKPRGISAGAFSVTISACTTLFAALRNWSSLQNNDAINYVYYSLVVLVAFVFITIASRSIIIGYVSAIFLIALLSTAAYLLHGNVLEIFVELEALLIKETIPEAVILGLGATFPLLMIVVFSIAWIRDE